MSLRLPRVVCVGVGTFAADQLRKLFGRLEEAIEVRWVEELWEALEFVGRARPTLFLVHEALGYEDITRLIGSLREPPHRPPLVVVADTMALHRKQFLLNQGITACVPLRSITVEDVDYLVLQAQLVVWGPGPRRAITQ